MRKSGDQEESGLTPERLTIIEIPPNIQLIEHSRRGVPSVQYLVATTDRSHRPFTFQETELASVVWMPVKDAMVHSELKNERKELLQVAVELVKHLNLHV